MGKTYIDTVKYVVYATVDIGGLVEKPDVVGAVFGQTEGLLGDELDLRDLQKNGRIGRIEVDLQPKGGRSKGTIRLPSSLDMVETCILAASLETVDRIGPCDAKISVEKIEDTRSVKRKDLIERAKGLLKTMIVNEIPESKEISEMVREEVKVSEISSYGVEKLPCGPGIEKYDSIVVVEGRADVLNLLKNDVTNIIGVGGANVTETIANLCRKKEVTAFLDGDRGGDIILRELANVADIDFVARAPRGMEVEELSRKELIKCLRARVPYEQTGQNGKEGGERNYGREGSDRSYGREGSDRNYARGANKQRQGRYDERGERPYQRYGDRRTQYSDAGASAPVMVHKEEPARAPVSQTVEKAREEVVRDIQPVEAPLPVQVKPPAPEQQAAPETPPEEYRKALDELENTLRARFYSAAGECVKEIPVRDIIKNLEEEASVGAIVFDGIITQRLADMAENKKVKFLFGVKIGNVFRKPASVQIITKG
ncbi:hypothetical protein COV61_02730 [Candidatus Micrarchaeota archaeon CG11_big_fil_rev_8_21_14_0_20_47_5]|nr:MAG: hypothetical protein AUJ17_01445 [Candidatus Micrarchaeota archaeon CG1_02_47_40]PIN83579.1 MAG: hypothetical protein COV61_02730 [Candidatus Micrarchaeota archaeon CG11_big_fil_rev_8_21_14_0_20_47_5]